MTAPTKTLLNIIAATEFGKAIISKQPVPTSLDLSRMYMPASDITELSKLLFLPAIHPMEKSYKSFWGRMAHKIKSLTKIFQKEQAFKEEFLGHKGQITELNLSHIYYTNDKDDKTKPFDPELLIKLVSLPKLQSLDLSCNQLITGEVAKAIVLEAMTHPNIKHLSFKSNKLDAVWISSIVKELASIEHPLTIEFKTVGTRIPNQEYEEYTNIFIENGTLYCNKSKIAQEREQEGVAIPQDVDLTDFSYEEEGVLEFKEVPPDSESLASFIAWEAMLNEDLLGETKSPDASSSEA